jgi:hypothetical protein
MADTAFQTIYLQELVNGFEFRRSLLGSAVTNKAMVMGNQAVFNVVDSGGATAVTRGVNGLIPARVDNNTQNTATLAEWHDLVKKTDFNIFASQGDQRALMQMTTMAVINRKIDLDIIAMLDTATHQVSATAASASLQMVTKAKAILGNNYVPTEEADNMFAVISYAMDAYLMQIPEYTRADYVDVKGFTGAVATYKRWAGVNWILHPLLTGNNPSSEKCYMFHRSALGHVVDTKGMSNYVDYNAEQGYTFARCSVSIGSKLLQQTGIVQILHDGSGMTGT